MRMSTMLAIGFIFSLMVAASGVAIAALTQDVDGTGLGLVMFGAIGAFLTGAARGDMGD